MANKLIQWNCRGLKANFNELLLLLTGLCPSIIFIIMGDFNSHSNVWGCRDTDQKGRIIEDVINRNNLLLYNNKSYWVV